jgi:opacity protein-like surface antigen
MKMSLCVAMMVLPQYVLAEPYVGAALGYGMTTIEKEVQYNDSEFEFSDHYNNVRAQLLLGYNFRNYRRDVLLEEGMSSSEMFFAVEAGVTYATNDADASIDHWFLDTDAKVTEQLRYQADLFLLVKYAIQPYTLLFAGLGVSAGQFEIKTATQTAGNLGVTGDETTTVSGWGIKAGVEIEICEGISLIAAYQYNRFDSTSFQGPEPLTTDMVIAKYKPTLNAFTLGVMVH